MHKTLKGVVLLALASLVANNVRAAAPTLTGTDVGSPSLPGSITTSNIVGGGTAYTIVGGGSDIWNASDNCFYAYFKATGDFDYVMKVQSLKGNAGDGGWSKAELMVSTRVFTSLTR